MSSLKLLVLRDYFELSGLSKHKTVTNSHLLTIPDEFGAEYDRNIVGISIGIFFSLDLQISLPNPNHYVKSALKDPGR